jgi:hypothetical protein
VKSNYQPSERILQIQAAARQRYAEAPESRKTERMKEAFFEIHRDAPLWERQARAYAHALIHEPILINPDDGSWGVTLRDGSMVSGR